MEKERKVVKRNLLKNPSTRLRFSIYVIIANFIIGILAMFLKLDIVAVGTFLSMCNSPLYIYILGRSYRGETKETENV